MHRSDLDFRIKKTEEILDKEEQKENGRGKQGYVTVLNCLLFELEDNISKKNLERYKDHIYEIDELIKHFKENGWDIPSKTINDYNKIKEKYFH